MAKDPWLCFNVVDKEAPNVEEEFFRPVSKLDLLATIFERCYRIPLLMNRLKTSLSSLRECPPLFYQRDERIRSLSMVLKRHAVQVVSR